MKKSSNLKKKTILFFILGVFIVGLMLFLPAGSFIFFKK